MDYTIDLITIGAYGEEEIARRRGIVLDRVTFIVAHDTGNDGSTAIQNVNYYKNTWNEESASAHIFVDDKESIICVPAFKNAERAHHVLYDIELDNEIFGDDANDEAIGVEWCYFSDDKERTLIAYQNYIEVIGDLMEYHNLNSDDITSHSILDPNRKTDPENALAVIGKTWEEMEMDVNMELSGRKKSWEQILGEKSIDSLAEKEYINNPEEHKEADLKTDAVPKWLFFTMLDRITD